ncbi:hypothetical protein HDU85_005233 [Gaertneriomyces sp. JEL0708]|nr:hypothetical protein HDU85_005233 [Gaertneriomyces sp. JEL0708]
MQLSLLTLAISYLAAITVGNAAPLVNRSFYPPGYVFIKQCQTSGPVEVCALNRGYNWGRLQVTYTGSLPSANNSLHAYISLNSIGDLFDIARFVPREIGAPQNVHLCYRRTVNDTPEWTPSPQYPSCPMAEHYPALPGPEQGGKVDWYWDFPPQMERKIYFYAMDGSKVNAWDVIVAVVNEDGKWDPKNGANYKFRFE